MSNSHGQQLLGNLTRGLVFVVSAPAGTGKTTLIKLLTDEFPCVKRSISCTTRHKRPGEVDGVDYRFLSDDEFDAKEKRGEFLESAFVFGKRYGTSIKDIETHLKKGEHVVLVIDTQGALQIQKQIPATLIFIAPPSLQELQRRLERRGTESRDEIALRLEWAEREMEASRNYDYLVINSHLSLCYEALRSILIAEEHRVKHLKEELWKKNN